MEKNSLAKELRKIVRLLIRRFGVLEKSEASCCGVTLGQCHAIVEIGRLKKISLNELADILQLDKSTVSRTVDGLVKNEIVEREVDSQDRRYLKLKLTEKGSKVFAEIEKNMEQYFENIINSIPKGKQEQVVESLNLILNACQETKCC